MNATNNITENTTMTETTSRPKVALDMLFVVLVYTLLKDKGFRFNNPCVGVMLRADLVLTTLSCLEVSFHGDIDTNLINIYLRDSQVLKPERVFVYPDMKQGHNVALILCETSEVKQFPRLPDREFRLGDFEYCTLCGFGNASGRVSLENFSPMRINRTDMEVCNRHSRGQEWICLHFRDAIPCRGDVGAPLLCDGALHAIFNPRVAHWAAPNCEDAYGATFTVLYPAVPWIQGLNRSLEPHMLAVINSPWSWLALLVTAFTIISAIYYALMRYVDWMCDRQVPETMEQGDGTERVVYVKSSEMSRVSTRWLWPKT